MELTQRMTYEAVVQNAAFPLTATTFASYPFFLSTTMQICLQFSSMPRPLRLQWTKPTHHPAINHQKLRRNMVIAIPHETKEPIPSCFTPAHILSAWDVVVVKLCIHGYCSVYLFILFCWTVVWLWLYCFLLVCGHTLCGFVSDCLCVVFVFFMTLVYMWVYFGCGHNFGCSSSCLCCILTIYMCVCVWVCFACFI